MPDRPITPLDDKILEVFDAPDGLRDGLLAVYLQGCEDTQDRLQTTHTVNIMRADYDRLTRAVADYDANFPCDGGCHAGPNTDGPQEQCSRHGRSPRDLWSIIDTMRAAIAGEVR